MFKFLASELSIAISIIVGTYTLLLFFITAVNMSDIGTENGPNCNVVKRVDYLFPCRPLACWLNKEVK